VAIVDRRILILILGIGGFSIADSPIFAKLRECQTAIQEAGARRRPQKIAGETYSTRIQKLEDQKNLLRKRGIFLDPREWWMEWKKTASPDSAFDVSWSLISDSSGKVFQPVFWPPEFRGKARSSHGEVRRLVKDLSGLEGKVDGFLQIMRDEDSRRLEAAVLVGRGGNHYSNLFDQPFRKIHEQALQKSIQFIDPALSFSVDIILSNWPDERNTTSP
jgi:hypothetical protein